MYNIAERGISPERNSTYYQIPDVGTFAVVSSVSLNEPGPVVIPAEIEGRPVRDIGSSAAWGFGSSELITSVTVPASVKNIRARTFEGCTALKTAVLPDSMAFR